MKTTFETGLNELAGKVAEMGGFAEQLVSDSLQSMQKRDVELAEQVVLSDRRIDQALREVEDSSVLLIARHQPVALDLRRIVAGMRIASDLERVGDMAKNIAKRTKALDTGNTYSSIETGLGHLCSLALEQLHRALDAFIEQDKSAALSVWREDSAIDALYTSLFRELLTYMMEDPRYISSCTHLLFIAKNIERIGDHATNIAENVHYMITGEILPDSRPKDDESSFEQIQPKDV